MPKDGGSNPFRAQGSASDVDETTAAPFARGGEAAGGNQLRRSLGRKVREISLANVSQDLATARAGDLTVKDLNDLAAEFSGITTNNSRVAELTIEDLNSIEAVFYEVKMKAAQSTREAQAEGAPIFDNWSCCCCTPCCSCAATETDPFVP
jgi:hypothetical protein